VLGAVQGAVPAQLAILALEADSKALGGLSLLVEDGLRLATVASLLLVVTTLSCEAIDWKEQSE